MKSDLFPLVVSNLSRRKLRSWLTMIGIFIGIAAVVSLISLGEGLQNFVEAQFNILGVDVLTVNAGGSVSGPPGTGVVTPLTRDNLEALNNVPGVDTAFGRVVEAVQAEYNDQSSFVYVGSVPEGRTGDRLVELLNYEAEKGRLITGDDNYKVLAGNNFLESDTFGKPLRIGSRITIGGEKFEVVGIAEKKGSFITDSTILMSEENLRKVAGTPEDEYDAFAVKAKEGIEVADLKENVEKVMRDQRDVDKGEEDFTVQSNKDIQETMESTLFGVQLFIYIIAGISIVVGGIGIANTMYTAVLERQKDIGVMKSIGARNSTIFSLFFMESGFLGIVGGIIGIILGLVAAHGMAFIGKVFLQSELLSAHTPPWLLVGALLFSFLVGTISGLVPALQASKLTPVEALRQ